MTIKGDLTTKKDETDQYPWTAKFESIKIGTFYGYGETELAALHDLDNNINSMIKSKNEL